MISALSADQVLRAWEQGRNERPVDRALTILSFALPSVARDELESLPIGERDRLLFQLRASMLGPSMRGLVRCAECRERLEFGLEIATVLSAPRVEGLLQVSLPQLDVSLRLPDSRDMAWLAEQDSEGAVPALLRRCVTEARDADSTVDVASLGDDVLQALEEHLARADPLANVSILLTCDACHASFDLAFDIGEYLWSELAANAQRVLGDVHTLARSYGWSEADILGMSEARRHAYLELVGSAP